MDSTELGKAVWALWVMQSKIRARFGWLEASFLGLVLLALGMRLWELDGRVTHYDEAIHIYHAWRLSNLEEYIHSPWMHGPFQIEFTALIFRLFSDTDFTARLGYVLLALASWGYPTSFATTWAALGRC
jgi:predicted membrane-bound mannosyltransferase